MLGFIVAVIAGYITPMIEGPVARPLARKMEKHMTLEPSETRLLAFILTLLGAGVAASLLHSGTAFWIAAGVAIGYFGQRLVDAGRAFMDARKGS